MEEISVKSPCTFTLYGVAAVPSPVTVVFLPPSTLEGSVLPVAPVELTV